MTSYQKCIEKWPFWFPRISFVWHQITTFGKSCFPFPKIWFLECVKSFKFPFRFPEISKILAIFIIIYFDIKFQILCQAGKFCCYAIFLLDHFMQTMYFLYWLWHTCSWIPCCIRFRSSFLHFIYNSYETWQRELPIAQSLHFSRIHEWFPESDFPNVVH